MSKTSSNNPAGGARAFAVQFNLIHVAYAVAMLGSTLANTVMVVEDQSGQIAWMEPRDLQFEEALRLFTSPGAQAAGLHPVEHFLCTYYWERAVAFADGSVRFVGHGVNRDSWSALLTVDDGAKGIDMNVDRSWAEGRRLNVDNCFRLTMFLLLFLLPLPWVWLGQKPIPSPQGVAGPSLWTLRTASR